VLLLTTTTLACPHIPVPEKCVCWPAETERPDNGEITTQNSKLVNRFTEGNHSCSAGSSRAGLHQTPARHSLHSMSITDSIPGIL
jgi:hypothetical protein